MSQTETNFASALREVLEVVIFENWLRFYFINEKPDEDGKLFISIPERAVERLRELHPFYMPMVERLNNKEIDFQSSKEAICTFIALNVEGRSAQDRLAETVLDSNSFHNELQIFNTWVSAHEAQLDQGFLDFSVWVKLFYEWRNSKEVSSFFKKEAEGNDGGSRTVQ